MMKLTGTKVAEAKATDRERKLSDGGGRLALEAPIKYPPLQLAHIL